MASNLNFQHYPRVLFVTPHAFNGVTGGGISFSALFREWPKDCLATVHNDSEPVTHNVCDTYFKLTRREIDLVWPLNLFRRSQSGASHKSAVASTATPQPTSFWHRTKRAIRSLILSVTGQLPPDRGTLSTELREWIASYKPEVLYTILGTNGMMDLISAIQREFDLPLVVHFMDDWPSDYYRDGLLAPYSRARMNTHLNKLVGIAAQRMAISPAMEKAYTERFGHPFEAFQNTIDVSKWSRLAKEDSGPVSKPSEILYVGSIFANAQLESLVECAELVAEMSDEGRDVRLRIASPSGHAQIYQQRLKVSDAIEIEDTIRDDDTFFGRLADADLLLLPVNFEAETIRFIRYSMPTKVPAYLASGTPILAYGPSGTAQIDYAVETGWATVVDTPGKSRLSDGFERALFELDLRRRTAQAGLNAARQNHDSSHIRTLFQARLQSLAPAAKDISARKKF